MAADATVTTLSGNPIVDEAMRRFKHCAEWESQARTNFLNDYKFRHGDSYNGYQWPSTIRFNREQDQRPCLTMNVIRQHNLQITNEALQNKSSVAFRATGGAASKDSADIVSAMFRRVEYLSDAQSAYKTACQYQVDGGIGWIRLVTEYEDNKTFNQDLRIRRVLDPLSVYIDMDCQREDCSDANYGFVFDLVPDKELEEAYPQSKEWGTLSPLGTGSVDDAWAVKDHTRVCEYFRRVKTPDRLVSFVNPDTGLRKELRRSLMPKEVYEDIIAMPLTKWREIEEITVEWYLIVGQHIVDKTVWPGQFIPLVKVAGEETMIEGVLDRKGHTRAMLDAQRMYNYNSSGQVEFVALQGKTPWIAAAKAIEEFEQMWDTANVVNHSVLIYNAMDDQGNKIDKPERTPPPTAAPAYESGMATAFNQMMMTSGQWQNQMGMGGNERTGAAISRRQEQGYTAVYHFQDNFAAALRWIGKQYIDLFPKLYDTRRLMVLRAEDGEEFNLEVDPGAGQALQQQLDRDEKVVHRILNPRLGQYDVEAEVGPAYGTRRDETVDKLTLILTQNKELVPIIGDLLLRAMNFKEATEAAMRMKRLVPPQALGKGPSQAEQKLAEANKNLAGLLAKALQGTAKDQLALKGKDELRDIEVYDAYTKRIGVVQKQLPQDAEGMAELIHQLVSDSLAAHLTPVIQNNEAEGDDAAKPDLSKPQPGELPQAPPVPGAKRAPDGEWYVNDPSRKGKFLRVQAKART